MPNSSPQVKAAQRTRSKESIRRRECRLWDEDGKIPLSPSVAPPTPSPPHPNNPPFHTPNFRENAKYSPGSTLLRSKILCSTPYPPNRVVRKATPPRRASPFPVLIPSELTLSIVRASPLTAVEELTCGDHVDDGKEDSVSSTRPAEESAVITDRQCVAYGTPRGTCVAATATAGVTTVEEISESTEHTMGACTSKKSASGSAKKMEKSPPTTKPEKPPKPTDLEADEANDEEDPSQIPKFKLKRDSIAVTKVRMLKTQIHQENTIGEEEEDDDEEEYEQGTDEYGRAEDHVHFENHVSKESIPNDSGVSLNSCPDNDFSSIRFDGKLDCDAANEVSLASNVTIRSLRKENIVEAEFKSIIERTKQLFGDQTEMSPTILRRVSTRREN